MCCPCFKESTGTSCYVRFVHMKTRGNKLGKNSGKKRKTRLHEIRLITRRA